jgi:hypothetical protein
MKSAIAIFALMLVFALLPLGACSDSTDASRSEAALSSLEASEIPLEQLEMSEYDKYIDVEILPSIGQIKSYLAKVVSYHDAKIIGDIELWALDRGESTREIRHTQLVTYPVLADGKELFWGVDRNTGIVYYWSNDTRTVQPGILESPEVFPTPQSALEYAKNHFWDPSDFSVEFTLELIPGNPEAGQNPHYQSKPITYNEFQTGTYYIDISSVGEQSYLIHLYEVIIDSPEEGHTATTSWLRVYKNGFIVDEILFSRWIAAEAT